MSRDFNKIKNKEVVELYGVEYFNSAHIRGFFAILKTFFFNFFCTRSGWVLKDESEVDPTGNASP